MDRAHLKIIITVVNLFSLVNLADVVNCQKRDRNGLGNSNFVLDENTRTINLSNNNYKNCPAQLKQYQNLEIVILTNNLFTNVSGATCFHKSAVLRMLDFSYNHLGALPNFKDGPEVHVLNLTGNQIFELQPIAWYGLSSLRQLILDNNGLKSFAGGGVLNATDRLQVLSLRNNNIQRFCANLTVTLFHSAVNLRELYLSNNSLLDRNSSWLIGAPNLEILDLRAAYCSLNYSVVGSKNHGWKFPGHSTRLRSLDLSQNRLFTIEPWAFSGCENLELINLTNCSLNEFKTGQLQDMKKITHLYVDHNTISNISSSLFFDLRELRVLSMEFNNLRSSTVSPISFSYTENLEVINFSNNRFTKLDFLESASLTNLTTLLLDNNTISYVRLNKLQGLRVLSLYNNTLRRMPNITRLSKLQRLNLALNYIGVLNFSSFWTTLSPVTINLSNNKISSIIRKGNINTWLNYHTSWNVILRGNPIKCDCSEKWFQQETERASYNASLLRLYENVRFSCQTSSELYSNISYALDNSECVFIHRDVLLILGCICLLIVSCVILAIGMTLGKRLERRRRTTGGGRRHHVPGQDKKLMSEKEHNNDRRTDSSPAFMIAEKDQHIKDAISLSNLKGSMVRLDNENVKPFFREIYV